MADEVLIRLPRAQVAGFDPDAEQVGLVYSGAEIIVLRRQKAQMPGEHTRDYFRFFGGTRSISAADLFHALNLNHATGTVKFEHEDVRRDVYVRNGEIVFAQSNLEDERLGESLIRAGKISQEQLDEAARSITAERKLGQILVEDGLISPKELFVGVRRQVEEIVWSLFDGTSKYLFYEGFSDPDSVIALNLDTQKLVIEGLRRTKNWAHIPDNAPEREIILQLSSNPKNLKLNQEERRLASLIVAGISMRDLIEQSSLGSLETYKVVHHLLDREVVSAGIRGQQTVAAQVDDIALTVSNFQSVFDQIFAVIQTRSPETNIVQRINSFFEALPDELLAVFGDVRFSEGAQLDAAVISSNVESMQGNGRAKLLKAFNELLYFTLFESKNVLSDNDTKEIMSIIENMNLF